MASRTYYVYILTNAYNTVLYTGVTNDLDRRCLEHLKKKYKGFTSRYNVYKLVYFEIYDSISEAISREKQIKGYSRAKKNALIIALNREWLDLNKGGVVIIQEKRKQGNGRCSDN